ncbi:hypothetical protein NEOLEDRAFT_1132651 [Neolentinus lepideus HHB14362 ss-1]|uniref:Uncharacterized protein n=1 Tax=Neolentinus lepideus HHB14362 ss-1 TaxID=1314782 RepID=A0A165T3L5_9AGAM|nr:hypothetical protein NEOLEDRAFT_1132651 [Neolentinus lepideus HHB14362 ss-1]
MDDKRAQTFQALSNFIEQQRAILARTETDIARLTSLKRDISAQHNLEGSTIIDYSQLKFSGQSLGEQCVESLLLPKDIDWSLFNSRDAGPIRDLATNIRSTHVRRNQPSKTQMSPLSDLQRLVKDARKAILDPVLSQLLPLSDNEDSSEEYVDPETLLKEREREKIRDLKKRRIKCGLTVPLRARPVNGVFIRRDLDDESADVDIADVSPAVVVKEESSAGEAMLVGEKPKRSSKRSRVGEHVEEPPARATKRSQKPCKPSEDTVMFEAPPTPTPAPSKPKPETYKQAWTVSEQHLLERLLEEIPDGERNRWQKISQAMNGRRTPRQVASRVQKYFEKLKRFGIDPTGKASVEK